MPLFSTLFTPHGLLAEQISKLNTKREGDLLYHRVSFTSGLFDYLHRLPNKITCFAVTSQHPLRNFFPGLKKAKGGDVADIPT